MLFTRKIAARVEFSEIPEGADIIAQNDAAAGILDNADENETCTYIDEEGDSWTGYWTFAPSRDTCWEFTGNRY